MLSFRSIAWSNYEYYAGLDGVACLRGSRGKREAVLTQREGTPVKKKVMRNY